jgi:hypothetical protein
MSKHQVEEEQQEIASSAMVYAMLLEYLGSSGEAIAFMRAFAGVTIRVPSSPAVERVARERQIVDALNKNPETTTVRRLAAIQGTNMRGVAKSYAKSTGQGLKALRATLAAPGTSSIP